ncbi:hypothetical protein D5F01_LYC11333 [Larimichthys crocea]|uniref:Mitochondrial transcription rescue factor 1 C-terminal domain-containing protein n=1 Tax=Larimichthys crocea TaxID=215358 RepID=A0A6G0IE57_LARCR|nr:hypothetical protein D5F01_LYC11333 [Larimichthys crocea]
MKGYSIVTGWSANMQSLVVQALAMRQLGRLNPRHLLAAGYGLRQAEWFKSNKKKGAARAAQEEDEEDKEDEKDPEDSDYEDEVDENPTLPKDYKDVEKYVQSFRYDVIMKAGLDIARNKIEDAFYNNKLRINGQRLIKKSKTVKVGDTLDLVLSENQETNTVTLMRVIPRRVLGQSSNTENYKVAMRRWKRIELSKDEAFKP